MFISKGNIFQYSPLDERLPEFFESLISTQDLLVERIVTNDNFQTPGQWYDQDKNEWVLLLQGEAELEFEENELLVLKSGDFILIPSHKKHRVTAVSKSPNCIWLAIHGNFK
jgi:cupin 2 domain-containing protein